MFGLRARKAAPIVCAAGLIFGILGQPAAAEPQTGQDQADAMLQALDRALDVAVDGSLNEGVELSAVGEEFTHSGDGFELTTSFDDGSQFELIVGREQEEDSLNSDAIDGLTAMVVEIPGLENADRVQENLVIGEVTTAGGTVLQPMTEGFRVLHHISNADSPRLFESRFVTEGELEPVTFDDGSVILHDDQGNYLGDLAPPWAVDATGRAVPTHYEWDSGTLIQRVEHDPRVHEYPVVADPAWTYSFNLQAVWEPGIVLGVSTSMAMRELRRCFNCSFPISGAPSSYPRVGQNINLNAWPGPGSMRWAAAPVRVTSSTTNGFSFIARSGHFDGAGSTIAFRFYQTCHSGRPNLRLSVNAGIAKNHNVLQRTGIRTVARQQWTSFVSRTAVNAAGRQGVGARC